MTGSILEALPQTWETARDETFFRTVTDLFSPAYLVGATVLLASYDSETEILGLPRDVTRAGACLLPLPRQ